MAVSAYKTLCIPLGFCYSFFIWLSFFFCPPLSYQPLFQFYTYTLPLISHTANEHLLGLVHHPPPGSHSRETLTSKFSAASFLDLLPCASFWDAPRSLSAHLCRSLLETYRSISVQEQSIYPPLSMFCFSFSSFSRFSYLCSLLYSGRVHFRTVFTPSHSPDKRGGTLFSSTVCHVPAQSPGLFVLKVATPAIPSLLILIAYEKHVNLTKRHFSASICSHSLRSLSLCACSFPHIPCSFQSASYFAYLLIFGLRFLIWSLARQHFVKSKNFFLVAPYSAATTKAISSQPLLFCTRLFYCIQLTLLMGSFFVDVLSDLFGLYFYNAPIFVRK